LRRGEWRALVAPALAPLGTIAFFAYLWARTGVADAWFKVEREVWQSEIDFGDRLWEFLDRFLHHPIRHHADTVVGLTTVVAIVALVLILTAPGMPTTYRVFGVWMLVLPVFSAELLMRPRWVFTAFPAVLAAATRVTTRWMAVVAAVSAAAMCLLVVYYGYFGGTDIVAP
jgi:hypothetical protein